LKQFMPRQFKIEGYSTIVLSDRAVLFAGFDTFLSNNGREGCGNARALYASRDSVHSSEPPSWRHSRIDS
jgi:hypothetical protein